MLTNYIVNYTKLIPANICKKIISYFDEDLFDSKITGPSFSGEVNKNIRNCKTSHILQKQDSFGKIICLNYIQAIMMKACLDYRIRHPYAEVKEINQLDLLKYETNSYKAGYSYHIDYASGVHKPRQLSISICLNNEFKGGDFRFSINGDEAVYPQNEGDCLIFPSNFMFPHQVDKVTQGTRYALIGWAF